MKFALAFVALMFAAPAFANDGGVAHIKVSEIKMREYDSTYGGKEIKRITDPHFKITIKGGQAKALQQILPAASSVDQVGIEKEFKQTFKVLGIYSEPKEGVTSKALSIECSDGIIQNSGTGKASIKKLGETTCTITIDGMGTEPNEEIFGDTWTFAPKCSN